jgi:hypothetical protein
MQKRTLFVVLAAPLIVGITTFGQTLSFSSTTYDVLGAPRAIVAADFDNDGRVDLAVGTVGIDASGNGGIVLLANDGTGKFTNQFTLHTAKGPFALITADFNSDGAPDLAVTNADANMVSIYLRDKRTRYGFSFAGALTPPSPRGVATGDFNRDGKLDLAVTSVECHCLIFFQGQGDGQFLQYGGRTVPAAPTDVAVGDIDRDGILDLATTGNNRLAWLFGDGSGSFSVRRDETVPFLPRAVLLANLNRSGNLDAVAVATGDTLMTRYDISRTGSTSNVTQSTSHSDPRDVATIDLNGDGIIDLISANRGSGTVSMFEGIGTDATREYQFTGTLPAQAGARALAVADFDLNGRPDIATGNEYDRSVTVLRNNTPFPHP